MYMLCSFFFFLLLSYFGDGHVYSSGSSQSIYLELSKSPLLDQGVDIVCTSHSCILVRSHGRTGIYVAINSVDILRMEAVNIWSVSKIQVLWRLCLVYFGQIYNRSLEDQLMQLISFRSICARLASEDKSIFFWIKFYCISHTYIQDSSRMSGCPTGMFANRDVYIL